MVQQPSAISLKDLVRLHSRTARRGYRSREGGRGVCRGWRSRKGDYDHARRGAAALRGHHAAQPGEPVESVCGIIAAMSSTFILSLATQAALKPVWASERGDVHRSQTPRCNPSRVEAGRSTRLSAAAWKLWGCNTISHFELNSVAPIRTFDRGEGRR
jgi:hypothetical protein